MRLSQRIGNVFQQYKDLVDVSIKFTPDKPPTATFTCYATDRDGHKQVMFGVDDRDGFIPDFTFTRPLTIDEMDGLAKAFAAFVESQRGAA